MFNLMIVGDERDVVDLLSFLFKNDENNIITAYTGKEALQKMGIIESTEEAVKPDLLLLDVMMPEIDGYTVVNKMLGNDKFRDVPIVILTAKGQMKDLFSLASNVIEYIEKPFDLDDIKRRINHLIEEINKKKV